MKSSIIICTYNEEETIADVVSSTCKFASESEVIVVDDGSNFVFRLGSHGSLGI